ncbi:Lipoprotein OS=Streptomyces fumanus OX=67302 GN=GCM10018772_42370 PE=4 SV=1 [Streptomyces fumanus]
MTVRRLLALPVLGLLLAGCGIRATEVPTDYGPAPSRVRCSPAGPDAADRSAPGMAVQVFLLCGSSLMSVDRTVRVPDGTADSARRVLVAQGLLDRLAAPPSAAGKEAGYTTDVRAGTTVSGARPGDPEDTLRLSTAPDELTSYALAQIVCTFSDSAAAEGDGSVVLGGPGGPEPRRYTCTDEVRARPGSNEPPSSAVAGD